MGRPIPTQLNFLLLLAAALVDMFMLVVEGALEVIDQFLALSLPALHIQLQLAEEAHIPAPVHRHPEIHRLLIP